MPGSFLVADAVLDASLQYLEDNVDFYSVCESTCTTYEHAHSEKGTATGKALATSATPTFTGPTDGATGRKTTVDEEASMSIAQTGTAEEVCLCDTSESALLYKTTCTSQALTAGGTVTGPSWTITFADPIVDA